MPTSYRQLFRFKQFDVYQDTAAMKIGTDGVLLGAWADFNCPKKILDVGTGTGVIALMLAQRFLQSQIHAVEIDAETARLADYNFKNSKWFDRIRVFNKDFLHFNTGDTYDLIVSNPPYFDEQVYSQNKTRDWARHTLRLNLEELIKKSASLLTPHGKIQIILPADKEILLRQICVDNNLYINKITSVKGNLTSPVKRMLVSISFVQTPLGNDTLVIEKQRHVYTDEYIDLTKDFYLKM